MARHARTVGGSTRGLRATVLTLVWLAGLAAGVFALLSASARYTTCGSHSRGLACRHAGLGLGVLLVLGVVATVTTVTVATHDREPRRVLALTAVGLLLLIGWFLAARSLLSTA